MHLPTCTNTRTNMLSSTSTHLLQLTLTLCCRPSLLMLDLLGLELCCSCLKCLNFALLLLQQLLACYFILQHLMMASLQQCMHGSRYVQYVELILSGASYKEGRCGFL